MPKTIYRADDGKEFDFEFEAHQHEGFLANMDALHNGLAQLARADNELDEGCEVEAVAFVKNNPVAILGLLKEMAKKPEKDDDEEEDHPYRKTGRRR